MDRASIDRVMGFVEELAEADREMMERQIDGVAIGQEQVSDAEFAAWFELKVSENADWAPALAFVEGGMALVRRYERLTGLREAT